jgi:methanogenic corrinoid protein MtbC1
MFRWCAYCQRLIGERAPLASYEITHGICEACEKHIDADVPDRVIVARDLLAELIRIGREGDLTRCDAFVRSALDAGLRPSEILIGILQPALCEIGARWKSGEISVSDEHRFTAFSTHVLHMVPLPLVDSQEKRPIVLVVAEGNQHDLGIQMLQRVAMERGHRCLAIHPGLPDREIVLLASRLRPSILGISVSSSKAIPDAVGLCESLQAQIDGAARVVLGGNAFRHSEEKAPEGVVVLRTIDEFLAALDRMDTTFEAGRSDGYSTCKLPSPRPLHRE